MYRTIFLTQNHFHPLTTILFNLTKPKEAERERERKRERGGGRGLRAGKKEKKQHLRYK